jgi:hypothetical protein
MLLLTKKKRGRREKDCLKDLKFHYLNKKMEKGKTKEKLVKHLKKAIKKSNRREY